MDLITTTAELAAACARLATPPLHHRRHRVPARDHLLSAALRRADGKHRRGRRDRRARARHRPQAVLRADGEREGAEGLPCRPPGHRDRLAPRQARSASDLRHPGRGHGARLWRFHLLRPAGAAHHRRPLDKSHRFTDWSRRPLSRAQITLRGLRRHPSARRLHRARRRPQEARPHRLGQRGDGGPDLAARPTTSSRSAPGSGSRRGCASPRSLRC